ncbi:MAG: hypothetical protein SGPRY_011746 [Prymnesium sp.]
MVRVALVENFKARGNMAMRNGDPVAARAFYSEALEVPEVPQQVRAALYGNRTACLLALNQPELAAADAERALELVPGWVKGHFRLGCARESMGDLEGARRAFEAALELEPDNTEIKARLGKCIAQIEASFDERKREADGAFNEGRVREATELYSSLLRDKPADVRVLSCRSACHLHAGEWADVEEDVGAALALPDIPNRTHLKLLLRRAQARLRTGRRAGNV